MRRFIPVVLALPVFSFSLLPAPARAATTGTVTEDFSSALVKGGATANWNTASGALSLAGAKRVFNPFSYDSAPALLGSPASNFGRDAVFTDLDGDGDLDLAVANQGYPPVMYRYDGSYSTETPISADAYMSQSISAGDVDGDGDNDLVVANYDIGGLDRLYLNDGSGAFSGVAIAPDLASQSNDTLLADFNGDGKLDLAISSYSGGTWIYLNDGSATPFTTGGVSASSMPEVNAIAGGDIDGDGDLDIATANNTLSGNYNEVLLNNGDGTFTVLPMLTVPLETYTAVAPGDIDGDGDLDLVYGVSGGSPIIFFNTGSLPDFAPLYIDEGGPFAAGVALGDVDADGDLDLVFSDVDGYGPRLYVNLNRGQSFNGTQVGSNYGNPQYAVALADPDKDGLLELFTGSFSAPHYYFDNSGVINPFEKGYFYNASVFTAQVQSLAKGDFNRDGFLDYVEAGLDGVYRIWNNNGDGYFTQATSTFSAGGSPPARVAAADFNGDGRTDVLAARAGAPFTVVLSSLGSDPFYEAVTWVSPQPLGSTITSAGVGDFDGDGDVDVVTAGLGESVKLWLSDGLGSFALSDTGVVTNARSLAVLDYPTGGDNIVIATDISQDSFLMVNDGAGVFSVVALTGVTDVTAVAVRDHADGADIIAFGRFGAPVIYYTATSAGAVSGPYNIGFTPLQTTALAITNFNLDGYPDIVAGLMTGETRLYFGEPGALPFSDSTAAYTAGSNSSSLNVLLAGRFTRDEYPDILAAFQTYATSLAVNQSGFEGLPDYAAVNIGPMERDTWSLAAGDIDGDGDLDFVEGNSGDVDLLFINNGSETPFASSSGFFFGGGEFNPVLALADFDGDSDLDLVTAASSGPLDSAPGAAKRLYLNGGQATGFFNLSDQIGDLNDSSNDIAAGDLNSDGYPDLVTANGKAQFDLLSGTMTYTGQQNKVYLNNKTSSPFASATALNVGTESYFFTTVVLGDMNGDGLTDIVTAGRVPTVGTPVPVSLYLNQGSADPFGAATPVYIGTEIAPVVDLAAGDVDKDGDLDLVVGKRTNQALLYLNNGGPDPFYMVTSTPVTVSTDPQGGMLELSDVNNDGYPDLVVCTFENKLLVYLNNHTSDPFNGMSGGTEGISVSPVTEGFTRTVTRDFNSDGIREILAGNGAAAPTKLFGPAFVSPGYAESTPVETGVSVAAATLDYTGSVPLGGEIEFYLSNDGSTLHKVLPGQEFVFPSENTKIKWLTRLSGSLPVYSPLIESITVDYRTAYAAPSANAGADSSVDEDSTVDLTGGYTDPDNDVTEFLWEQTGGPTTLTLSGADTASASFTAPSTVYQEDLVYTFKFTVTDSQGMTSSDEVTITVVNVNQPPVAVIDDGATSKIVNEGENFCLDGSYSSDPEGGSLTYDWSTVVFARTAAAPGPSVMCFDAPQVGPGGDALTYRLIVADPEGATNSAYIAVVVLDTGTSNLPPVANAGADIIAGGGQQVVLSGTASSDPDGTIVSWLWVQDSGPTVVMTGANTPAMTFTAPPASATPVILTFALTVTDNGGLYTFDTVTVTVVDSNDAPAPPAKSIVTNQDVAATVTIDPGDPDTGDTHTFALSGSPENGTVSVGSGGEVTYIPNAGFKGSDQFSITVTDSHGASGAAVVNVTVEAVEAPTDELVLNPDDPLSLDPDNPLLKALAALIGDFNGDGVPDLVAVDGQSDQIYMFVGDGLGGFVSTPVTYSAGGIAVTLSAGDLNNDGKLDLIVVVDAGGGAPRSGRSAGAVDPGGSYQLSSLLGSGTGFEDPVVDSSSDVAPLPPAVGDIDGDGDDDVAATGSGPADVEIYESSSGGSGYQLSSLLTIPAENPGPPVIADVNGDGEADIVVADTTAKTVTANLNSGDGTFTETITVEAATGSNGYLATGDFNNDQKMDVATTGGSTGEINILLWDTGSSSLELAATYTSEGTPSEVIADDFNNDTYLDLAVLEETESMVRVLLGTGTGGFDAVLVKDVGGDPASLSAGDVDNDNYLDIAVVDRVTGEVRIFRTDVKTVNPPKSGGGGGGGGGCFLEALGF
jgi:hypothetical protein